MTKPGFKVFCPKVLELGGILENIGTVALKNIGSELVFKPIRSAEETKLILTKNPLNSDLSSQLHSIIEDSKTSFKFKIPYEIVVSNKYLSSLEEIFSAIIYGVWKHHKQLAETENELLQLFQPIIQQYQLNPMLISTSLLGGFRISQLPFSQRGIRLNLPKDMPWVLIDNQENLVRDISSVEVPTDDLSKRVRLASLVHGTLFSDLGSLQFSLGGIRRPTKLDKAIGFGESGDEKWFYIIFQNRKDMDDFIHRHGKNYPIGMRKNSLIITEVSQEGVRIC
ncbi:MAG: hypothetical protein EA409_11225 [Saprospirales bacterium]|nr:MAG: hypothetical protein EA409_11225 [Saprospirales bacterium]